MSIKFITLKLALVICILLGFASTAAAENQTQACADITADWPLWSSLAKHPWTLQYVTSRHYFPLSAVLQALQTAPFYGPFPPDVAADSEDYARSKRRQQGYSRYLAAAKLYKTGDLINAIPLFDAIVSDKNSRFRAAAAYSAARAAIRLGRFEDGARRIDSLVRDASLSEFHYQAYDLLSKMRYDYDIAALNAAELAEATHMLAAPSSAVCGDPVGEKLRQKFGDEIGELIVSSPRATSVRKVATEAMSRLDPLIAVADAVSHSRYMRRLRFDGSEYTWNGKQSDADNLGGLRTNWKTTNNPLWAVALVENSFDEADLAVVPDAIKVLHQWPGLSEAGAARYAWRLVAQAVRIELVRGNLDQAVSFARLLTKEDLAQAQKPVPQPDIVAAGDIIMGNGVKWFIRKYDYASARRWAISAHQAFGLAIPSEFKPVLAQDFNELYGDGVFGLQKTGGKAELGNARAMLDLLPGSALISMSNLPQVASDDKRAMVGAAWTRAYALQHWSDVFAWLPDMKSAFPELREEVREIENAKTDEEKRHLATRLLAGAPGLIALPSWSRPPGGLSQFSVIDLARPSDIHLFDTENRNDGNWWCAPDPDWIEAQAVDHAMDTAVDDWDPIPDHRPDTLYQRSAAASEADKIISAFPILKAIDLTELQSLASTGSASKRIAADVAAWAADGSRERHDQLPETLFRALRGTRYGCQAGMDNGPWSHEVFADLHQLYPKSSWTKDARYWFGRPVKPVPETASVASQGKSAGLYMELPKGLTKCPGRDELFLKPPASCDGLDAETGVARHFAPSPRSITINVNETNNIVFQNVRPLRSDNDLAALFCKDLPGKLPAGFTFLGTPAIGCSKEDKEGVEMKIMSLFFTPGAVPGNASAEEKHAKNVAVMIDLKTTPADFAVDVGTVRKMVNSASLCLPKFIQSFEDSDARSQHRANHDLAKELALPACPPSMDQW